MSSSLSSFLLTGVLLSSSSILTISVTFTFITSLIGGVAVGSLVTFYILKRKLSKQILQYHADSGRQLYEETTCSQQRTAISKKVFEMGQNAAYGPVLH